MIQITRRKNMVHVIIKENPYQTANNRHCIVGCKDLQAAKKFKEILVNYNALPTSTQWTTLDKALFDCAPYGILAQE